MNNARSRSSQLCTARHSRPPTKLPRRSARGRRLLIPPLCKSPRAFALDEHVGELIRAGAERGDEVSLNRKISHPTFFCCSHVAARQPSSASPAEQKPGAKVTGSSSLVRGGGKRLRSARCSPRGREDWGGRGAALLLEPPRRAVIPRS